MHLNLFLASNSLLINQEEFFEKVLPFIFMAALKYSVQKRKLALDYFVCFIRILFLGSLAAKDIKKIPEGCILQTGRILHIPDLINYLQI